MYKREKKDDSCRPSKDTLEQGKNVTGGRRVMKTKRGKGSDGREVSEERCGS